jgi:hypothetical protein
MGTLAADPVEERKMIAQTNRFVVLLAIGTLVAGCAREPASALIPPAAKASTNSAERSSRRPNHSSRAAR